MDLQVKNFDIFSSIFDVNDKIRPKLNHKTHELTANMEGQLKRQEAARKRRETFLVEEKERQKDAEMEECSFEPEIHGREKSEKLLAKANR